MNARFGALLGFLVVLSQALGAQVFWKAGDAPDTVLVSYRQSLVSPAVVAEGKRLTNEVGGTVDLELPAIQMQRLRLPSGSGPSLVNRAIEVFSASPLVLAAEPDPAIKAAAVNVNDSIYTSGYQWYLTATAWPQAVSAYNGGAISFPGDIIVAVIDTGVDPHFDLSGQLLAGTSFVSAEPTTDDQNGHGTFCAGLIAARTGSNTGMAGAFIDSTKVKILPVKVLNGCGGGNSSDLAAGVLYAVAQGARVINMSVQSSSGSTAMEAAVISARSAGSLIVAAAGNDYGGPTSYPANYSQVFAVGALDHNGYRAAYGNFGKLELSAPGGDLANSSGGCTVSLGSCCTYEIWSLAGSHGGCGSPYNPACPSDGYEAAAGTSFAAPLVAAAAAMLFSQDPTRRVEDIQRILMQTASATAYGAGYSAEVGWGKLNFAGALLYQSTPQSGGNLKAYNWPNPFNPDKDRTTTLTFILPDAQSAKLRLLDAGGDLVRQWELSGQGGLNFVLWDGRNGQGDAVANGAYTLVVESGGKRAVNTVAVLH